LALSENTNTTNGQEFIWSITSKTVEFNLSRAQQEFYHLSKTLRKMSPEHAIFEESTFMDNVMETGSFGSNRLEELKWLYWEMRASSFCLDACIIEVEQSAMLDRHQTGIPLPSGSAAPPPNPRALVPDGIQEWGGAGIVDLCESITRGAGSRRGQDIQHSLSRNYAMGREQVSTGGGFLGACVGDQQGQEDTCMNNREVPQVVEPVETAPPVHGVMGRPTATE
jgi:hypothetical protein